MCFSFIEEWVVTFEWIMWKVLSFKTVHTRSVLVKRAIFFWIIIIICWFIRCGFLFCVFFFTRVSVNAGICECEWNKKSVVTRRFFVARASDDWSVTFYCSGIVPSRFMQSFCSEAYPFQYKWSNHNFSTCFTQSNRVRTQYGIELI